MPNDFILSDSLELKIENGDFVVSESTYQHQQMLILSEKGDFKQYPTVGVGSKRFLESEKPDDYAREIRQEFIADKMKVRSINIARDLQITIDANY